MVSTSTPGELDDPFARASTERTFIVPKPGARVAAAAAAAAPAPVPAGPEVAADFPRAASGLNPLVALANEVLALVPSLQAC